MRFGVVVLTTIAIAIALLPMITVYQGGPDGTTTCVAARDAWNVSSACDVGARHRMFLTAAGLGLTGVVGCAILVAGATRRRKRELAAAL